MYTESELVRVAKRENNTKRNYLVVNRLQAKHVPVEPHKTIQLFDELADKLKKSFGQEKLLLIGFAETATAIGSRLAIEADSWYMQTTREDIKDVEYLYFSESHSHATEQKLIKDDLDRIIHKTDRIVFVEDEVTTGDTIMKIIEIIRQTYDMDVRFSVACILNGMDEEHEAFYRNRDIDVVYLVKTEHDKYTALADKYEADGGYCQNNHEIKSNGCRIINTDGYVNGRRLVRGSEYKNACEKLWENVKEHIAVNKGESVLVLGTEEFMYPAIHVAAEIEKLGCKVKCHSTTRSPIEVSKADSYPLHCRYQLRSMYDLGRTTFVYDIGCYDKVLIITDAGESEALTDLTGAITRSGNSNIALIRWCER